MNKIAVIGASGFALDVISMFWSDFNRFDEVHLLDDNVEIVLKNVPAKVRLIHGIRNSIENYDTFCLPIGNNKRRKEIFDLISELKPTANFITLFRDNTVKGFNIDIGIGCIIMPGAFVGSNCKIGDMNIIQINAVIGHDTIITDFCRVDCGAIIVGGSVLRDSVYVHSNAVVGHNVILELESKVSALTYAHKSLNKSEIFFNTANKKFK